MLTDEQCETVIEWLERHEFTGFTNEDIRLMDSLISAARSEADTKASGDANAR